MDNTINNEVELVENTDITDDTSSGEVAKNDKVEEVKEKHIINIPYANLYTSPEKSRKTTTVSGEYAVVSIDPVSSGRVQIYDPIDHNKSIGWVNASDLLTPPSDDIKANTKKSKTSTLLKEGDTVRLKEGVTRYSNFLHTVIPSSVKESLLYVRSNAETKSSKVFISTSLTGAILGTVKASDLTKADK